MKRDIDARTQAYKRWRRTVLRRDNYTCQMTGCGKKTIRRKVRVKLHVHHILRWADAPLLRYNARNGITLCDACHKKVNNNEAFFVPLFLMIVQRNSRKKTK